MTHKTLIIKLSQNERYCSECKKVKNEKEFDKSSPNKKRLVLKSIENTVEPSSKSPSTTSNKKESVCKECSNVKNKIMIDLSQNEKYCTGCKSVKDQKNFSHNQDWCKECKSKLMKKYYEKNISDHRVATLKNYESKRVETVCECGRSVYLVSLKAHLKTKIHTQMLEIKQQIKK